jgi:4-alpha-glucanotransferase
MKRRGSGILCHITSLPSPYGLGDLGPGAYAFADFLAQAKQSYWQILPLNPTNGRYAYSPFTTISSCAGNTLVISPDLLLRDGLLSEAELQEHPPFPEDRADYDNAARFKQHLFRKAHARFRQREGQEQDYLRFCRGHACWLEEHALFSAIYAHLDNAPLAEWPGPIKKREEQELARLREELSEEIEREKFLQYMFYRQWHELKNYCNERAIHIIGDFPLFLSYDAADIWSCPQLFKVDDQKRAYVVAGSPPDNFSPNGQVFNCALYDWDALRETGFEWWLQRFHCLFKLYDCVRIDHFRGLCAYWEVPGGDQDAVKGSWQPVPTGDFFNALLKRYPSLPVIAEDLGTITADVREAMGIYGVPGMKLLVLAFEHAETETGGFLAAYLPHNHVRNSVCYTGTHDTNTVVGWCHQGAPDGHQAFAKYVGHELGPEVNWDFIRLAMMSVAETAIFPIQDVLGTGEESRMNYPGKADGNWVWRLRDDGYRMHAPRLAEMTLRYGRAR